MSDATTPHRDDITEPPARTSTVAKADPGADWFTDEDGWTLGLSGGPAPEPGALVEFWGRGIGYPIRGLAIGGHAYWYETADQHAATAAIDLHQSAIARIKSHLEELPERDAAVAALPDVFRRRLERFRSNNPEFRWENEPYEMVICEGAVTIAQWAGTPDRIAEFQALSHAEQRSAGLAAGHSGNTFDMACRLAHHYLTDPELVVQDHAGLALIIGCKAAGCHDQDDQASAR